MDLCRNSSICYQNEKIIEETLTAEYIEKVSTRPTYVAKFREYKREYTKLHHKAKNNPDNILYSETVQAFIEYMKPYNQALKNDEMSKKKYLKVLDSYQENKQYLKILSSYNIEKIAI